MTVTFVPSPPPPPPPPPKPLTGALGALHGRLARRAVEREVDRDAEHVRHLLPVTPGPKLRITAVAGVGRHSGLEAPLAVGRPFVGQIQAAVDEGVPRPPPPSR